MNPEQAIISQLAASVLDRLVHKVVRALQSMDDCLSGDDSGLANVWDEVCVQVQYEQSVAWDAYLAMIEGLAEGYVADLKKHELDALWLATPEGEEWSCEDEDDRGPFNPITNDIVRYVIDSVLAKAGDWSNARIREYLDDH